MKVLKVEPTLDVRKLSQLTEKANGDPQKVKKKRIQVRSSL